MPRTVLHAVVFLMLTPTLAPTCIYAQGGDEDGVVVAQPPASGSVVPEPIGPADAAPAAPTPIPAKTLHSGEYIPTGAGYAVLDAPLYPCPKPGIPLEVGATVITNPALNPHEMLYPHKYCALYPPFYYKTRRSWIVTPFGVHKHECRTLTGTQVIVKYKPCIGPLSLFCPPCVY